MRRRRRDYTCGSTEFQIRGPHPRLCCYYPDKLFLKLMSTGINLHFETHGSGSPILMLHGFGASLYTWRYLVPAFTTSNKLILVDLKGFGKSPKPKDKFYRIQDQADLIYQFIVQQDLRGFTLIGHSMGGGVALLVSLMLAKEKSDRLSRLVLIDSAGYRQKLPAFIAILRIPIIGPLSSLLPNTIKARIGLKTSYFDDTKITRDQVAAYAEPLSSDGGSYALFRTAEMLIPADIDQISSQYNQITVPTLIVWGRNDEVVPLEIGNRLHEAIANSELTIIDRCGHIPHEEKPAETIEVVRSFLQRPT